MLGRTQWTDSTRVDNVLVSINPINHDRLLEFPISSPQDPETLPHTIRRITHNAIEKLARPQRRIRDIRGKRIQELASNLILLEVLHQILSRLPLLLFTPKAAGIDIRAQRERTKMRRSDQETARAHKRIEEDLPRRCERHIRRHQTQLCVHGRRADILALLEVVLVHDLPVAAGDQAAHIDLPRLRDRRCADDGCLDVPDILLQDDELLLGIPEPDRSQETHVPEGLDDLPLGVQAALPGVAIHLECERDVAVVGPARRCSLADVGVHFFVGGALAPELGDTFCQDAAGYQRVCCGFVWQLYDTIW